MLWEIAEFAGAVVGVVLLWVVATGLLRRLREEGRRHSGR